MKKILIMLGCMILAAAPARPAGAEEGEDVRVWVRPAKYVSVNGDVNKFSASVIVDVLRAHPLVIMGGVVRPNLFYVPPNGYLEELSYRGSPAH